jgi:ABC-type transport system substrate-binding protein
LRKDVRFWNGRLVTAADWVYSFERIINPATQAGGASFWMEIQGAREYAAGKARHVSGIKANGQFGLRIDLVAPDASFLDVVAMSFGSVVDKNQIARYGNSYAQLHPMGTGPYMFREHQLGRRLILVRNPHYFLPHVGHVDTIEADIGVSDENSFLRVQRGQNDIAGLSAAQYLSAMADPTLRPRIAREVQVAVQYITMNTLVKPFDNVLVRRAVEYAIDKQRIVRIISGRGIVANTFIPPNMPGYGAFNLYPYNPARARQLLAQAGYPKGFTTTFYSDNLGDDPRVSQAIIPMLANVGITAQLRVLDFNTWAKLVGTKGKVPMAWSPWALDFPDPNDFFEPTLSCESAVPGTFNEAWYCNPTVDAFAHKLKIMTDRTARLRLYPQLDQMVMRDAPVVPVYNPILYVLPSAALHHFYLYPPAWEYIFADYGK